MSIRARYILALPVAIALAASAGLAQSTGALQTEIPNMLGNSAMHRLHAESAIEVVFVLDTTGSMSGLIEGAKAKIWAIANQIATAQPRPTIRMGLVGYRDRGDEYITTLTALTDDLDAVYSDLMGYAAGGGGDGPESVNQALHEAVTKCSWTPRDDESAATTLRLIYLVGDAPPHMDYEQDVKYHASCEEAAKRGIIINTIQCGTQGDTTPIWQEIARLAEGEYFAIEQSGGMLAIATPYDAELAELSTRLSGTLLAYGDAEEQKAVEDRRERARGLAAEAPASAAAERAMYVAKDEAGATLAGRQELVQDLAEGKIRLDDLEEEELPPELRELPPAERDTYVRAKAAERAAHQARIGELGAKRQQYIHDEMSRLGGERDSFDQKVLESLRSQAARVGIRYE
jgi:Mg-chelatase subunit ChlD